MCKERAAKVCALLPFAVRSFCTAPGGHICAAGQFRASLPGYRRTVSRRVVFFGRERSIFHLFPDVQAERLARRHGIGKPCRYGLTLKAVILNDLIAWQHEET